MRMTTVSSGRMTTQALISGEPSAARTTAGPKGGRRRPRARPPPTAAVPTMNERRVTFGFSLMASPSGLRGRVNRLAHFLERAAAADVGHRGVDVRVGGLGLGLEQRRSRHDHAALAIAALRHCGLVPRVLHLGAIPAR